LRALRLATAKKGQDQHSISHPTAHRHLLSCDFTLRRGGCL
jgi:methylmalonyl-CoA mutase cobalamin-binding subunit